MNDARASIESPIRGSCLCGGVEFEVDELSGPIGHCHCRTCRKAHSAAYATTARARREHFRWTRGEELVKYFESSPGKRRHFCGQCGSQFDPRVVEAFQKNLARFEYYSKTLSDDADPGNGDGQDSDQLPLHWYLGATPPSPAAV